MSRREELAQVRERVAGPVGIAAQVVADRRFLLGLVDELAAAIEQGRHRRDDLRFCNKPDQCQIKAEGAALVIDDIEFALSDLGPDA